MIKLISKGQTGLKIPNYFKIYGINADKLYGMFKSLLNKGLGEYPSLMYAWQAIKEQPKKYYAFGKSYDNVDQWALHSYEAMTGKRVGGIYKNAQNATNYDEWRKAMKSFNTTGPKYWNEWLTTGLDDAHSYLRSRYALELDLAKPEVELPKIVEQPDALRVARPELEELIPVAPTNKNGNKITYFR